jgi:hypothetical protein
LKNGNVLLIYGTSSTVNSSQAEIYRPTTDDYVAVGSLLGSDGTGETVGTLNSGLVLIAGGFATFPFGTASQLYSAVSNTFTATAGSLQPPFIANMTATKLTTGEVLFLGGEDAIIPSENPVATEAQTYEPSSKQFVTIDTSSVSCNTICAINGDCGPSDCPDDRVGHQATLLPGGDVLITGGFVQIANCSPFNGICDFAPNSAWLYNPTDKTFQTTFGFMTTPRIGHTATLVCGS